MSDASNIAKSLRERLSGNADERLGKALSELLENPLITGAISRAFDAREKASQAQEVAMGALNIPSAADIERLTRRLRAVSHRLEGIEDGVHRLDRALAPGAVEARLSAIEQQLGKLTDKLKTDGTRPVRAAAAAKPTRSKTTKAKAKRAMKAKATAKRKPASKAKASSKAKAASKAKATRKAKASSKAKAASKAKATRKVKATAKRKAKAPAKRKAATAKRKVASKAKAAKTKATKAKAKAKATAKRKATTVKRKATKAKAKATAKRKAPAKRKAASKAKARKS